MGQIKGLPGFPIIPQTSFSTNPTESNWVGMECIFEVRIRVSAIVRISVRIRVEVRGRDMVRVRVKVRVLVRVRVIVGVKTRVRVKVRVWPQSDTGRISPDSSDDMAVQALGQKGERILYIFEIRRKDCEYDLIED